MALPPISREQQDIINKLRDRNLIVDSVAGSGKTTTNIYIAKQYADSKILLLTYNAKLKIETRERIKKLNITNMECHSYHSFCVKYYYWKSFTDTEIRKIISDKIEPIKSFNYDIIILDEAQDITNLYYELVCKINSDNAGYAKLCLLGDRYQSIYGYNNADERYLIHANQLFNFNEYEWARSNLATSFRITIPMAEFINECMLKYKRISAVKVSNNKPRYLVCNPYREAFYELRMYLDEGYKPNEIFILAPSLRSVMSPARILENHVKTKMPKIPIYVPSSDEAKITPEVTENKLIFSTFHQAKGLERKVVIVFGFDEGYMKFHKKEDERDVCPNELYVACTRGLERLTVIHSSNEKYLPFIDISRISEFAEVHGKYTPHDKENKPIKDIQVTDLMRHLPCEVMDECMKYFDITHVKPVSDKIEINRIISHAETAEEVSEINGVAIPAYFEYQKTNKMTILNWCKNPEINWNEKGEKLHNFWEKHVNEFRSMVKDEEIRGNLLRVATFFCSLNSGYIFKMEQIKHFDWIGKKKLDECMERIEMLNITDNARYEVANFTIFKQFGGKLCGRFDCVDNNTIYEFKCAEKLDKTHYIQLAVYMYMEMVRAEKNTLDKLENIQKYGLKNIQSNDEVEYLIEGIMNTGTITKVFKNDMINIRNSVTQNIDKIHRKELQTNITYNTNNKLPSENYRYILYNVLTDEASEISSDLNRMKQMMGYLMFQKYRKPKSISDADFIRNGIDIYNKYFLMEYEQSET